jgi:hypothetical protein
MNIGKLSGMAKDLIDKRGGMDALKKDAAELKDIATSKGSVADKAKRAADALKDPGGPGADAGTPPAGTPRTDEKPAPPAS